MLALLADAIRRARSLPPVGGPPIDVGTFDLTPDLEAGVAILPRPAHFDFRATPAIKLTRASNGAEVGRGVLIYGSELEAFEARGDGTDPEVAMKKLTPAERAEKARNARALQYVHASVRDAIAKGRRIVIGDPIEIVPSNATRRPVMNLHRLNEPSTPIELPADKEGAKRAVAKALGLGEDAAGPELMAALESLLAALEPIDPVAIEVEARSLGLSEREVKMLAEVKCDPNRYLALKQQRSRR